MIWSVLSFKLIYHYKNSIFNSSSGFWGLIGENEAEEKESIDIEFTEQKSDPENDQKVINFRRSDVKKEDEEDIVKSNLFEGLQKQVNEEISQKATGGLLDDYTV